MKKLVCLLAVALLAAACSPKLPDVPKLKSVELPVVGEDATWKSDDYKGKPVLMVFMGSWCPWCKRTIPAVVALNNIYGKRIEVVAAFVDATPGPVRDVATQYGLTVTSLYNANEVSNQLGVQGLPQTMLFDGKHRLVKLWGGYSPNLKQEVAEEIEKLIK